MPSTLRRAFAAVRTVGLSLPGETATVRNDGSPVLQVGGCFMAGLATHPSAEPGTLVIRADLKTRDAMIEDGTLKLPRARRRAATKATG